MSSYVLDYFLQEELQQLAVFVQIEEHVWGQCKCFCHTIFQSDWRILDTSLRPV